MVGVGLARGLPPSQVVSVFVKTGPLIFRKTIMRTIFGLFGLLSAKYGMKNRREAIRESVGDVTLGELAKNVMFSSFELDSANKFSSSDTTPRMWKPKFFHNFPGPDSDASALAVDVVLRSSAAPTFFPIYQGFIDGGVIANNPSMCGLAQAMHPNGASRDLGSIALLSLGVGLTPKTISSMFGNFGLLGWGIRLIELVGAGSVGVPDYQCRQLLGDRYLRIDPVYTQNIGIDDANGIDALIAMADNVDLAPYLKWIDDNWM
jgi:patatin-like phospholipase/acyl hydrolase